MSNKKEKSTIIKMYFGYLGHVDDQKPTQFENKISHKTISRCKNFVKTLSEEQGQLVNELIDQFVFAFSESALVRYESGFNIGLGIGYECSKCEKR